MLQKWRDARNRRARNTRGVPGIVVVALFIGIFLFTILFLDGDRVGRLIQSLDAPDALKRFAGAAFGAARVALVGLIASMNLYWCWRTSVLGKFPKVPQQATARLLRVPTKGGKGAWMIRPSEITARREYWGKRVANVPLSGWNYLAGLPQHHRWTSIGVAVISFKWVIDLIPNPVTTRLEWSRISGFGTAIVVGALLMTLLGLPHVRRRLRISIRSRSCPDCRYDLSRSEPAIPPSEFEGVNIGPRRCPECGSLWPLVPPPVSPTGCLIELPGPNRPSSKPHEGRPLDRSADPRIA